MPSKYRIIIALTLELSMYNDLDLNMFPMDELEAYLYLIMNEQRPDWKMIDWLVDFIRHNPLSDLEHPIDKEPMEDYYRYEKLIDRFNEHLDSLGYQSIPF